MSDDRTKLQRETLATDFHRPRFHFLPPSNWMNDPNGVIQWKGQYHLFYQHNPTGAFHGNIHWGHAVSHDLIHWKDLPIALSPTPDSVDESGIFSGCAVDNGGQPIIFYTGVSGPNYGRQVQCMAIGSQDLIQWEKYSNNPVIDTVPDEAKQTTDFRDPFVWHDENGWHMIVGSRIENAGGTVFLYRSEDLIHWHYVGPILIGDKKVDGVIWECPNMFRFGEKWVFIVSTHSGEDVELAKYFVGTFENGRLSVEFESYFDYGYLYAPLTFVDDKGRQLLWGWLREGRAVEAAIQAGWSGVQAIPRQLSLDDRNRLLMEPVVELESIRGEAHRFANVDLLDDPVFLVRSLSLDMVGEFALATEGILSIYLASSESGNEQTQIIFDRHRNEFVIKRQYPPTTIDVDNYPHIVRHDLDPDESLTLRIILDGSTLEIIANKRTSISTRIYPTSSDNNFVRLNGKQSKLMTLDIYEMPSIWQ